MSSIFSVTHYKAHFFSIKLQYNSGGIDGSEHKTPLTPKFRDANIIAVFWNYYRLLPSVCMVTTDAQLKAYPAHCYYAPRSSVTYAYNNVLLVLVKRSTL